MTSIRLIAIIVLLTTTACHRQTPKTFAKYDLGGGRYSIEIEDTLGGATLSFDTESEGTTATSEKYDVTWGESHGLRIENGKLTVDDTGYGTLKPGDRVVVRASGDVVINGAKR